MKLEPASKAPGSLPVINDFPISSLELAPDVFQHKRGADAKTGETGSMGDIQAWDESKANRLTVFTKAPHRGEPLSSWRTGTNGSGPLPGSVWKPCRCRFTMSGTVGPPRTFRAAAAFENIAGGSLDALDVAMVLRETGITDKELADRGISLRKKETKNGFGLAKLADPIWDAGYAGRFDEDLGAAIGNGMPDNPASQEALFKFLKEREAWVSRSASPNWKG